MILVIVCSIGLITLIGIDLYVKLTTISSIITIEEASTKDDFDYILILGAGLNPDGTPSPMLKERLDTGIELYKEGIAEKIIVSGDHLYPDHDEVNSMKNYMTKEGIPSDVIYMDHAGLSTYDSIYRAKELFGAGKIVVVTQKYHLYRSLYIGKRLGLDVFGVDAMKTTYNNQLYRDTREILARIKDFAKCLLQPSSQILGESIPVSKGGNATNDKEYIVIKPIDKNEGEIYLNYSLIVERISGFFDKYEFTGHTCKEESVYTMTVSDAQSYDIELAARVHIVRENEEIILDEEDSNFFKSLLE